MTETLSTGTPRPVDGRHRRRVENLEAVVEATLELISENGALPTVAEVAERAGISQRSVFRYFDDVDQLTRAAVDARFRQGAALVGMPSPIPVALDDRLRELAASRSRLFEFLGPTARVVRTRLVDNPVLIESVERSRHALRSQLREVLAPELEAAGARSRWPRSTLCTPSKPGISFAEIRGCPRRRRPQCSWPRPQRSLCLDEHGRPSGDEPMACRRCRADAPGGTPGGHVGGDPRRREPHGHEP